MYTVSVDVVFALGYHVLAVDTLLHIDHLLHSEHKECISDISSDICLEFFKKCDSPYGMIIDPRIMGYLIHVSKYDHVTVAVNFIAILSYSNGLLLLLSLGIIEAWRVGTGGEAIYVSA